jgi:hypothetical protein
MIPVHLGVLFNLLLEDTFIEGKEIYFNSKKNLWWIFLDLKKIYGITLGKPHEKERDNIWFD